MKLESLGSLGLFRIEKNPRLDQRGLFERIFCVDELSDAWGGRSIVQINRSITVKRGAVRGLHYQRKPFGEMKMVQCLRGKVIDYAVDLRIDSKTFLKSFSVELSAENSIAIIIPEGFAHGFQVLEENSELIYFHSAKYQPDSEGDLNFFDPRLKITLPMAVSDISDRDKNCPFITPNFKGIEY
jgi:dTDP-4-dehydrorhamnose 3,5-epimerase